MHDSRNRLTLNHGPYNDNHGHQGQENHGQSRIRCGNAHDDIFIKITRGEKGVIVNKVAHGYFVMVLVIVDGGVVLQVNLHVMIITNTVGVEFHYLCLTVTQIYHEG